MTKLEKLYSSIQTLKELGAQLPHELIEQTNQIEEDIIRDEVIPLLEKSVSPILSQIERELVLIIDYVPNEPIRVKLSRKRSFSSGIEQQIPETKEIIPKKAFSIPSHNKSAKTILEVKFSNGKIISERFAKDTLIACIEQIGEEKIEALNISFCGVSLVSKKEDDFYSQSKTSRNFLVMTHSSTAKKKEQLDEISRQLKLGLEVNII